MEQRNTLSWRYKVKNVTSLVNLCQIRFTSMWKRQPFSLGAEEPTSWVKLRPNTCLFLVILFYFTSQQTQSGACAEYPSVGSTPEILETYQYKTTKVSPAYSANQGWKLVPRSHDRTIIVMRFPFSRFADVIFIQYAECVDLHTMFQWIKPRSESYITELNTWFNVEKIREE